MGKSKEPPGRQKIAAAGMIFAMFLRWPFISFFSFFVHFSSVLRVFIRSCISPLIERTSIRTASLLLRISLLRYLLIIAMKEKRGKTSAGMGHSFCDHTVYRHFRKDSLACLGREDMRNGCFIGTGCNIAGPKAGGRRKAVSRGFSKKNQKRGNFWNYKYVLSGDNI